MTATSNILRKVLKIIAWVFASILAIFILVLLLIRLPAIQNYAVDKVTSFVSSKTGTVVSIGNIYIGFPSTVIINEIFLDDLNKDTLLHAKEIRAGVGLFGLIKGDISLGNVSLTEVTANLKRNSIDSTFNFNFLINAFASKNKPATVDTVKKPMNITVDKIELFNVHFAFKDDISGLNLKTYVGEVVLPVNDMDLDSLRFNAGDIEINNTRIEFIQLFSSVDDSSAGTGNLPEFTAQKLSVVNSSFHMIHPNDSTGMYVKSGDFEITDVFCNLKTNVISANKIDLDKSSLMIFDRKIEAVKSIENKSSKTVDIKIPFQIDVKKLEVNNSLFVVQGNDTLSRPEFNPENLSLVISNFEVKNIYHHNGNAGLSIVETNISDRSGLAIRKLKGDFKTTPISTSIANLELKTGYSEVNGMVSVRYRSLQKFIEEPGKAMVNLHLTNSLICLDDLLLLKSDLIQQEIISKNRHRNNVINMMADGTIDNLNLRNFSLQTGNSTFLNITGSVYGLPDSDKLFMDLVANRLTTTASDINSFITLPEKINIPENVALSGNFKGSPTTFEYKLYAGTNRGRVIAIGAFYNIDSRKPGYKLSAKLDQLDLGFILKNEMLGNVNLSTNISGEGFDPESMTTVYSLKSDSVFVNDYSYNKIEFMGAVKNGTVYANGKIDDENLQLELKVALGMIKEQEFYEAEINLKGIDLEALKFTDHELRASGAGVINLHGNNFNNLIGNVEIKDVLIVKDGRNYPIESLAVININEGGKNSVSMESSLLTAKFNGSVSFDQTAKLLSHFVENYFSTDSVTIEKDTVSQMFNFSVMVKNAPVISEVFIPGLDSFIPGPIIGTFNSKESLLNVNIQFPQVIYKGISVDSLSVKVDSDVERLNFYTSFTRLSVGDIELARTDFVATASNNKIRLGILIVKDKLEKLKMQALLTPGTSFGKYKLTVVENQIILNGQKWLVPDENYVQIGGDYPEFHNFSISHDNQIIAIDKPSIVSGEGIGILFRDFNLNVLSEILDRDTSLFDGVLNGKFDLVREKKGQGIVANVQLDKFSFKGIPVGDFMLDARSQGQSKYLVDLKMSGNTNDLTLKGYYIADSSGGKINADIDIGKLNILSLEPFTGGQISRSKGSLSGKFKISGSLPEPNLTGDVVFNEAGFNVTYLNNYFILKNESLKFKDRVLYLDAFTITDTLNHTAILNGGIRVTDYSNPEFMIDLKTDRFLALNTKEVDNSLFFGTVYISSNIKIRGDKVLPLITSNVKMMEGSSFTFVVPETTSSTERGEEDVKFTDPYNRVNSIMKRETEADTFKTEIKGFDITSNIEITKESTLRILVDRESGDSLVIKGDATMSFSIDPSGKTSLTGGFEISDGSYRVSLQNLVKKNFAITKGSSINWRGDIMDAEINIDAVNVVNAVPLELVADQVAGLTEQEINAYRQRLPFQVILHMKGELIKPDISFEISLPPEDQGVLNGTVYAKLTLLNQDPSELNKQVFALLVLNRFVQTNPFDNSSGGGLAYVARNSVSKFLSQQLNSFAEQFIKGVELNFDVQSYEEYTTGSVEGRTEVNVGVKKRFFKDRLIVEVSGNVDVEGERTQQNDVSNLAGDVVLEYLLTEDGRYRLSVFRKDQYAGILDGEVTEAGIGLIYTRDFDSWDQFLSKPKPPKLFNQ